MPNQINRIYISLIDRESILDILILFILLQERIPRWSSRLFFFPSWSPSSSHICQRSHWFIWTTHNARLFASIWQENLSWMRAFLLLTDLCKRNDLIQLKFSCQIFANNLALCAVQIIQWLRWHRCDEEGG